MIKTKLLFLEWFPTCWGGIWIKGFWSGLQVSKPNSWGCCCCLGLHPTQPQVPLFGNFTLGCSPEPPPHHPPNHIPGFSAGMNSEPLCLPHFHPRTSMRAFSFSSTLLEPSSLPLFLCHELQPRLWGWCLTHGAKSRAASKNLPQFGV